MKVSNYSNSSQNYYGILYPESRILGIYTITPILSCTRLYTLPSTQGQAVYDTFAAEPPQFTTAAGSMGSQASSMVDTAPANENMDGCIAGNSSFSESYR